MILLHVGNSYSRLEGLTVGQLREVQKLTDYKIDAQAAYFSGGFKTVRHLVSKKGEFPSGLLGRVKAWLKSHKHEVIDSRKRPAPQSIGLFKFK